MIPTRASLRVEDLVLFECPLRTLQLPHENSKAIKFGQRLLTTYPHVSGYILLKTRIGDENR